MLYDIIKNLKDFFDMTVFFAILFVGLFTLIADYRYFKSVQYKRDSAVALGLGIFFVALPFVLLVIAQL